MPYPNYITPFQGWEGVARLLLISLIKVAHFDNKDFNSFDLDLPIYRFNKEKKKK
jgi:hypothetical protein